jgi:hypothetical protein
MRFIRDWSVVTTAGSLVLLGQAAISGGRRFTLLWGVCAGLGLLCVCWFTGLAWWFGRRRDGAGARPVEVPRRVLGEWCSLALFPMAAGGAFVTDGAAAGIGSAAMLGFIVTAVRVLAARHDPDAVTMSAEDRARLVGLLKLTGAVAAVGYTAVIVIAIAGATTWAPIWPAIALGLLCGLASLAQLARVTAAARRDRWR